MRKEGQVLKKKELFFDGINLWLISKSNYLLGIALTRTAV